MNIIIINLTKIHWDWKFLLDISSEENSSLSKFFSLEESCHQIHIHYNNKASPLLPIMGQPIVNHSQDCGLDFISFSIPNCSPLCCSWSYSISLVVLGPVQSSCTVLLLFLTIGVFSEHVPYRLIVYPFSLASGNDCA